MVVSTVQAADEGCSLTSLPRRPREMGHAGGCPSKANDRAAARALVRQHLVILVGTPRRRGPKIQARTRRFRIQRRLSPQKIGRRRRANLHAGVPKADPLNEFGVSTCREGRLICRGEFTLGCRHYRLGMRVATRWRCTHDLGCADAWRVGERRDHMHSGQGMPRHARCRGSPAGIERSLQKGDLSSEPRLALGHSRSQTGDGGCRNTQRQWSQSFFEA